MPRQGDTLVFSAPASRAGHATAFARVSAIAAFAAPVSANHPRSQMGDLA